MVHWYYGTHSVSKTKLGTLWPTEYKPKKFVQFINEMNESLRLLLLVDRLHILIMFRSNVHSSTTKTLLSTRFLCMYLRRINAQIVVERPWFVLIRLLEWRFGIVLGFCLISFPINKHELRLCFSLLLVLESIIRKHV